MSVAASMEGVLLSQLERRPFTALSRPAPREAYQAAVDEYLDRIKRLGTVRAVYQIGSVSVPGLSDIDLILVLPDRSREPIDRYAIRHLSPDAQYLFSHDPLFTDAATFARLPLWFPAPSPDLVDGEAMSVDAAHAAGPLVATIHVVQMLLCYQLQLLRDFAFGEQIHERLTDTLVKGFCNTVALWESVVPSAGRSSWAAFAAQYLAFRRGWFDGDAEMRRAEFRRQVAVAVVRISELIDAVGAHLREAWFEEGSGGSPSEIRMGRDRISFVQSWNPGEAIAGAFAGRDLQFPSAFGVFLRAYGRADGGPVSRHVGRMAGDAGAVRFRDPAMSAAVRRHGEALDDIAAFHRLKFRTAANPFVTFWTPAHPNRLVRAFDRLSNRASRTVAGWRVPSAHGEPARS